MCNKITKRNKDKNYEDISKNYLMILPLLLFTVPTNAQETLWNELNTRATTLYQQGQYSEAVSAAKEALEIAEKTFGPNHPSVAISLNNLALLYGDQGKYAEAEPLLKRALQIREKALGPDHPDVATVLENMAECYKKIGKDDEAKRLKERAKRIRSKNKYG